MGSGEGVMETEYDELMASYMIGLIEFPELMYQLKTRGLTL